MELLQLRYFVAAAREENVTRAAQKLHIAQPALSQSIARLEEEMGVRLFDRIGKRIRLNAAGRSNNNEYFSDSNIPEDNIPAVISLPT